MLKSINNAAAGSVLQGIRMGFTLSQKETQASKQGYLPGQCVHGASVEEELASGKRLLEEYSVGEAIGEGAFGVVYACAHRKTRMQAGVKMVDKVETPTAVIRREAELMKSLSHDNIVRFHAVYFERCFVCIVMDKYSGGDLVDGMQTHMKEHGKINPRDIIHVSYQMAASIKYLHGRHIAHRDIKGDNFLITTRDLRDPDCKVALSDFGTAELVEGQRRLSSEVGTRIFWAPEIWQELWLEGGCLGPRDHHVRLAGWPLSFQGRARHQSKRAKVPKEAGASMPRLHSSYAVEGGGRSCYGRRCDGSSMAL